MGISGLWNFHCVKKIQTEWKNGRDTCSPANFAAKENQDNETDYSLSEPTGKYNAI